jgi:hypothetical protein
MRAVLILIFFGSIAVFGEDSKYPVSAIPEELTKDVNVVYRENQLSFTIHAQDRATLNVRKVVTILNANGKDYAIEVVSYDKLSKVTSFKGYVYDASGNQINRLKASEIYDQSAFDGFSLYSDNRFKRADLSQGSYPYTVEIEYEVEFKFLFFIPDFALLEEEKVSAQQASYTLIFPEQLRPRYKTFNVNVKSEEKITKEGLKSLSWNFKNVTPIKFEPLSRRAEFVTRILTAPSTFEFDGYVGSMKTWEDFGLWINSLNKNRNVLPPATIQKIKALTANATTNEEKIKILYEFMQNKTRYVSIQLGIGGFQPFEASVVDQTGYGDCKALSNYMVSMLEQVGVKANYTLIYGGDFVDNLEVDFPSSQFNHAIVSVPNGKDTLWLECTSQTNPFGYQGRFTGDRKALMITDKGASVVNTVRYTAEQNLQSRHADVFLDLAGNAHASIETKYSGLQYESDDLNRILSDQHGKQKEWLQENTEIPTFNLNSFTITNIKDKVPSAIVNIDLSMNRFASVSGKRLFLSPNLMNKWSYIPEKLESRKSSVILKYAFTDLDTIRYHLPEGIYPEFLPDPVIVKSRFGEYESRFVMDSGQMIYIRRFRQNKGKFPAASYQELTDFFKSVNKADHVKMVFLNKT